jgi:glycosyltransferase involved in cell wall biosynthesis
MSARKKKKVCVLIPCYNEAEAIGGLLASVPTSALRRHGYEAEVIVIDNRSTDGTGDIARAAGATVIHEPKPGKGNAIRRGFAEIPSDTDYILMLDGDNTYRPDEMLRMLEPLDSGFSSVVTGSRLTGRITDGSMTTMNRFGNWGFTHLARLLYRVNATDVLTGYFAWTREALEKLLPHLTSDGFAIEMEMITKMARLGEEIYSVPISYHPRTGISSLRRFKDGSRILLMLLANVAWRPKPKRPRRIAFVSDAIMPYMKGGKEKRLYEVSRRLVSDDREVHIYTMHWWEGPQVIMRDGIYFHAISPLYPMYQGGSRSMKEAILFGLATFNLLFEKFDVLDVDHMPFFPLFAARIVTWLRGKRLWATWHEVWGRDYWIEYMKGPMGIVGYFIESASFMLPDVIISNSKHTTDRLKRANAHGEIRTVPLGADLENIYRAPAGDNRSDVIFVGRLLTHKNADLLVKAIRIVKRTKPEVTSIIVGDGPERPALDRLVRELDLEHTVQIITAVENHDELYALMKASKMLVLPSVREGFGLVVVEALAAGIPVISTAHPDNAAKDLIQDGVNGYLVEPTAEDIARKILMVLNNGTHLHPEVGIERYEWNAVVRELTEAWGI